MASRLGPTDQHPDVEAGDAAGEASDRGSVTKAAVDLSINAQLIASVHSSLSSLPEVDGARVAAVKAAIRNGDYPTDARDIAAAMIRFEETLLVHPGKS